MEKHLWTFLMILKFETNSKVNFEPSFELCVCVCACVRLFCFVLFCFVLFCFVLFCFALLCFVLLCFVLFVLFWFGLVWYGMVWFRFFFAGKEKEERKDKKISGFHRD